MALFLAAACGAETLPAQVAGAFYPGDPAELASAVDGYLAEAPSERLEGELVAALVPHAGYVYSGATAAQVYRLIEGRSYGTVILLGTAHRTAVKGAATILSGAFQTPLGEVRVDDRLVTRLRALSPLVEDLPQAYQGEHSLEVQLPFLQRVLKSFKIAPLIMNTEDPQVARQVGEALGRVIQPGKVLLLVSSDLSHYPDQETARAADLVSLAALTGAPDDPDYFWRTNRLLMQRGGKALVCTYCGESAVLAAQHAMKRLGARARLLSYVNSGELPEGEPSRAVGYAAMLWSRGGPKAEPSPLGEGQRRALLRLAREALVGKLQRNEEPKSGLWKDPAFGLPGAVFVTLRRAGVPKEASLRGCIGSLVPDLPLAEAVQVYAIQSALEDKRFQPVKAEELPHLSLEISKLSPFRGLKSAKEVRSGMGVVLAHGERSGLFLPQVWEQLPDKKLFLEELCQQKAKLPRDCWKDPKTEIKAFEAEVFEE